MRLGTQQGSERNLRRAEDSINPSELEYEVQTYHLRIQTLSVSLTNHSVGNKTWTIGVWAIDKKRYIIPPMKVQPQCSEDGEVFYLDNMQILFSSLRLTGVLPDSVSRDHQFHTSQHR
jgi:hypothetical protein